MSVEKAHGGVQDCPECPVAQRHSRRARCAEVTFRTVYQIADLRPEDIGDLHMFPVRCFSCNTYLMDMWVRFIAENNRGNYAPFFKLHGINRICCRRMFLTHSSIVEDIKMYSNIDEVVDESNTMFMCYVTEERCVPCD